MNHNDIKLDFDRTNRTGLAEAVLCTNKQLSQLQAICQQVKDRQGAMLYTRLDEAMFAQLETLFPSTLSYDAVSRTAYQGETPALSDEPQIAVVTGGSSDVPVAGEATRTLNFYGHGTRPVYDVGVAGLWRVSAALDDLRAMKIIICIAGMDAALPTVLGGLVPGVIIAVPSSVGYGVAKQGETALNALLSSCAPGLTVVNIDNGFGAACAAIRVLNNLSR